MLRHTSYFLSLLLLETCTSSSLFPISIVYTQALSDFQYRNVYLNKHLTERGKKPPEFNKDNDYVTQERYQLKRKVKLERHFLCYALCKGCGLQLEAVQSSLHGKSYKFLRCFFGEKHLIIPLSSITC